MDKITKISLVGGGNVAYHMGLAFKKAGLELLEIHTRNEASAREVIHRLDDKIAYQKDLDFSDSCSDLILICVSDDAIASVANCLLAPADTIVAHTSGAVSMAALGGMPRTVSHGVIYPLQSISKYRPVDFVQVPLFVEASDYRTRSRLLSLAGALSTRVRYMSSDDRKHLHLAGVFANNFINHLLRLSFEQLAQLDVDIDFIRPLVEETVLKAFADGPEASQTGPARRGDHKSMAIHLEALADRPDAQELYTLISAQIKTHFDK